MWHALLFLFIKKTRVKAALRLRKLVKTMSKCKIILVDPWTTSNIDCKTESLWKESNVVHLVQSKVRRELHASEMRWNSLYLSLLSPNGQFIQCIDRKQTRIGYKTLKTILQHNTLSHTQKEWEKPFLLLWWTLALFAMFGLFRFSPVFINISSMKNFNN